MGDYWGCTGQTFEVTLPALTVGDNDFVVTWPEAFDTAAYVVPQPGLEGGGSAVASRVANLKAGSRTVSGCVVTVSNTLLVSIGSGIRLHVFGYQNL